MVYHPQPEPLLSKADRVYEVMRRRIVAGEIAEGTQLKLGQVAAEMGISHVPVREAMRRLEAGGYVEIIRNKGVRVRSIETREYAMTLETLAVLEGAATALGYMHLGALELEAARAANDIMAQALADNDQPRFLAANQRFHHLLVSGCPNTVMTATIATLGERLTMIRNLDAPFDAVRAQRSMAEHDEILTKISRRSAASTIEKTVKLHRLNSIRQEPLAISSSSSN